MFTIIQSTILILKEENVYITTKTYVPKTNSTKNRDVKSKIM